MVVKVVVVVVAAMLVVVSSGGACYVGIDEGNARWIGQS